MESVAEVLKKNSENKSPTNSRATSSGNGAASPITLPRPSTVIGPGRPDCPHCGGMGFVIPDVGPEHPSFGRAVLCVCRAAEREAAQYDNLLRLSQLGALSHCTFETFLPEGIGLTPARQTNLKKAYERTLAFAQSPQGWLVLRGGYGCGKTHLAAAIANHQLALGRPVLFVNTPDLLDHLRATYSPTSSVRYDERFQQVRNAPLLVLDDLGTQSHTDWAQEKLYQIFNHRYNGRLPTVVTTNEELETIEIRIRSRLVDPSLSQIITILAPDFRHTGADQDQSDLSTLNLHSDQSFDSFDLRARELPRPQAENLQLALDTAKEFAENPADWLILYSVVNGNGKTHLAAAVANAVEKRGEPALFVFVPDLLDYLRATYNPASGARYDKRFDEVKKAPLLILDDLGTESATAWAREKLYQLFNYRYSARLPTVITTAVHVDELDPRLASRMLDTSRCTFFSLEVPSYRGVVKPRPARKRK